MGEVREVKLFLLFEDWFSPFKHGEEFDGRPTTSEEYVKETLKHVISTIDRLCANAKISKIAQKKLHESNHNGEIIVNLTVIDSGSLDWEEDHVLNGENEYVFNFKFSTASIDAREHINIIMKAMAQVLSDQSQ